ncbi:MAG: hypothetical protein EXR51_08900 [Dehalococcoidia bacterium]|nr:hypothetical protein [Dehalococcoidia bacterium]
MNGFQAVDAGVALKWVLTRSEEADVIKADALLEATIGGRDTLVVPPHFFAEVTNVLYQRVATKRPEQQITPAEAAEALETLRKLPIESVTPPPISMNGPCGLPSSSACPEPTTRCTSWSRSGPAAISGPTTGACSRRWMEPSRM